MIDYLISDQTRKIWINLYIFKVMNFVFFRDFSRIFLNFSRFMFI